MRVAIIGSGPVGMTAAMLLGRQGHSTVLVDRDPGPTDSGGWERVGVMQFQLPHGFRPQCRSLLGERLPDVLDAVIAAGATAPDGSADRSPGGSLDAPLLVRRSVFERALWEAASTEPAVTRVTGHADAVEVRGGRTVGVVVDSTLIPAELVIDAAGRKAHLSREYRPPVRRVDCGMAYAARQYRLLPGAEPGPRNGGPAFITQHRGFATLVFEHDAGTFTVLFIRPSTDKTLALLRHAEVFEAACRSVAGVADWTDPRRSEPIDVVRAGAGLTNEYGGQPIGVTGLVAIGDALCVTNPQGARGIPLGLRAAAALADLVDDGDGAGPMDLAERLDAWADAQLLPWFRDHVEWDAATLQLWSGQRVVADGPIGPEALVAAAQQQHPEWLATLQRYFGMTVTPDVLDPFRAEVRAMVRSGWQPPALTGPSNECLTRDELVATITRTQLLTRTQLNAETPVSA